jgi:hypothetical protein
MVISSGDVALRNVREMVVLPNENVERNGVALFIEP